MYIYHSRQEIVNFGECNYKCWNNTQVCVLLYKTKIKYTLGILLEHSSCPWHLEHLWLACTLRSESKDTIKNCTSVFTKLFQTWKYRSITLLFSCSSFKLFINWQKNCILMVIFSKKTITSLPSLKENVLLQLLLFYSTS